MNGERREGDSRRQGSRRLQVVRRLLPSWLGPHVCDAHHAGSGPTDRHGGCISFEQERAASRLDDGAFHVSSLGIGSVVPTRYAPGWGFTVRRFSSTTRVKVAVVNYALS